MPEAHAATFVLPTDHANEVRDETPGTFVTYSPRAARSWRAVPTIGAKVVPGYNGDQQAFTAEHMSTGRPDPRRVYDHPAGGGYPQPSTEMLRPGAETLTNEPGRPVPVGGGTTADPARPARRGLWQFARLFDQWASQNMAHVDKIEMAAPTAAMPITQTDTTGGAVPYPGGGQAPVGRMSPVGIQPNSMRLVPSSWDENLINTQPSTMATPSARRARGWRL
jgi:hypothetical protein